MSGDRTVSGSSWDGSVFDRLYAESADPWNFIGSDYEKAKYAATLAVLGTRHFANVLEVGCSIGVLTEQLASRADHVLAVDVAQAALERAAVHCLARPQVEFRLASVPRDFPAGSFDLMLFSEVLYFLDGADIAQTARLAQERLIAGGLVVLVNWTGETNTPTNGNDAAALFQCAAPKLQRVERHVDETYRLDLLSAVM